MRECESGEHSVGHFWKRCRDTIDDGIRTVSGLSLPQYKGEIEVQFIFVRQAQKECGR
jgi:hypothetical protein